MRDALPAKLDNYARCISMQEGVEMVERNRWNRSVTAQQKKLFRYSVRDILVTKEMVEYTDFLLQSAMGNAAEFIFCAI